MSALSAFMDALKEASNPQRPPEPKLPQSHAVESTISQETREQIPSKDKHHESGIGTSSAEQKAASELLAGEPPARPQLPGRDSLDDLFSEAGRDHEGSRNCNMDSELSNHNEDTREKSWASGGELFPTEADARSYSPKAPTEIYQDIHADFGSPQISPEALFHPKQQSPLMKPQPDDAGYPVQSALSEEQQIAYFSDKAFRKALREVEPALSKEQQYYAWRNAYQEAYEEPPEVFVDDAETQEEAATLDQNPPHQLGMEPVGYMDGVPIFADMDPQAAKEEIGSEIKQISSGEHDCSKGECLDEPYENHAYDPSDVNTDIEGVRPYNPFYSHHAMPAPTALRADMAKREEMLKSSFSEALQALEKDNAERMARESEVDEAHLRRLQNLSKRRSWAFDDGHGDEDQPADSSESRKGREGSPEPPIVWPKIEEYSPTSPSRNNQDESFATAFESPERQKGTSRSLSIAMAEWEEEKRMLNARYEGQSPTEDDMIFPFTHIPGLDHLNPPPSSSKHKVPEPAGPSTPPSPKSDSFSPNIRKSIEPETPHHLLNRDCTPAFEDRSPTPSPRSLSNNHGDTDIQMNEASSPLSSPPQKSKYFYESHRPSLPSPDPIASQYNHPDSQPQQADQPSTNPPTTTTNQAPPRSRSRSHSRSPTKLPTKATTSTSTPITSAPLKPTKQRPTSRRKSAVQDSGITKPSTTPRSKSRKVTTIATTKKAPTAAAAGKVREAVWRIEKSVLLEEAKDGEGKGGKGRGKKAGVKGTPPTRRSRRLIERREGTGTPEPEPV
jgi:hypothetical protein